jgi:hypothetical protein
MADPQLPVISETQAEAGDIPDSGAFVETGGLPVPTIEEQLADLGSRMTEVETRLTASEKREADFTEGLRDLVQGHVLGADGAAGQVVAIEGGDDPDLTPVPGPADAPNPQ